MSEIPDVLEEIRADKLVKISESLTESGLHAASTAVLTASILVDIRKGLWEELGTDWSAEKRRSASQIRRIEYHIRHPSEPAWLPEVYLRLGRRVDQALLASHSALYAATAVIEERRVAQERARIIAERDYQRRERLKRRREERERREAIARELAAKQATTTPRPKREEKPTCEKCGKRPRASGTLCRPCAQWAVNR